MITNFPPPQHLETEIYKQFESDHNVQFNKTVPTADLPKADQYAYSFYYKFTFFPITSDLGRLRYWWHSVAGFTQTSSFAGTEYGDRTLAIYFLYWGESVGFHATTYDNNCNRDCGNYWKNFDGNTLKDIQNSWTRIYFGYSQSKRAAFAYFKFERTG